MSQNITITYHGEDLPCPFCGELIIPKVLAYVNSAEARHVGTEGFTKKFAVGVDASIVKVEIFHECKGPKSG